MKPRNFPARKHARRVSALARMVVPNYGHATVAYQRTQENIAGVNDPRAVRTKINRSLKSFGR